MAGRRKPDPSLMGMLFDNDDSVMNRVFADDPNSLFGRIFGSTGKPKRRPVIRIRLTTEQAASLVRGDTVLFRAAGYDIQVGGQ